MFEYDPRQLELFGPGIPLSESWERFNREADLAEDVGLSGALTEDVGPPEVTVDLWGNNGLADPHHGR